MLLYLKKILNTDLSLAPLTLLKLEDNFSFKIDTISDGRIIEVRTGGTVDRIDVLSGVVRIVDYKTGNVAETIHSIGDLFTDDRKKESDGWLQTMLYCEAYLTANESSVVRPSVYKIKKLTGGSLSDMLRVKTDSKTEFAVEDYKTVRAEFLTGLKGVLANIFHSSEPFIMTTDVRGKCEYCPYRALCNR